MRISNTLIHNSIITLGILASFFFTVFFSQTATKLVVLLIQILLVIVCVGQRSFSVKLSTQIENPAALTFYTFALIIVIGMASSYLSFGDIQYTSMGFMINFPILLISVTLLIGRNSYSTIVKIILYVAIATSILSIAESVNYEGIPVVSNYVDRMESAHKDNPLAASVTDDDGIKAFGFFQNAFTNGMFISIAITILFGYLLYKKLPIVGWIAFPILIGGVLVTHTRNCYLVVVIGAILLILFKIRIFRNFARKYPRTLSIIGAILTLAVMSAIAYYFISTGDMGNNPGKIDSVAARVITWTQVFNLYMKDASIPNLLFGFGVIQWSESPYAKDIWAMDNIFVQLYMYSGFTGVAVFLYAWFSVTTRLIRKASNQDFYGLISVTVSFQFIFSGIFNASFSAFPYSTIAWVIILLGLAKRSVQYFPNNGTHYE